MVEKPRLPRMSGRVHRKVISLSDVTIDESIWQSSARILGTTSAAGNDGNDISDGGEGNIEKGIDTTDITLRHLVAIWFHSLLGEPGSNIALLRRTPFFHGKSVPVYTSRYISLLACATDGPLY